MNAYKYLLSEKVEKDERKKTV